MKRLLLTLALLWTVAALAYGPYDATLVGVVDGDTYDLKVSIWPQPEYAPPLRIRVANAQTPELRSSAACERALAQKAKDRATALLMVGRIQITAVTGTDDFGRTLAHVLVDDVDLGELLKVEGLARTYKRGDKTPWC